MKREKLTTGEKVIMILSLCFFLFLLTKHCKMPKKKTYPKVSVMPLIDQSKYDLVGHLMTDSTGKIHYLPHSDIPENPKFEIKCYRQIGVLK